MAATDWWKASVLVVCVGATLAGSGWLALSHPEPSNSRQVGESRVLVTSTRAS